MTKDQLTKALSAKGVKTTTKMTKSELQDLYDVHLAPVEVKDKKTVYAGSPEKY